MTTIGHQTVAEHSYHVAMLCLRLTGGRASVELLKSALYHDLAETMTGDVPAPAKWANPTLKSELEHIEQRFDIVNGLCVVLTAEERLTLKYADSLECAFYAVDQLMLGNRHMHRVYDNIIGHLSGLKPLANATLYEIVYEELKEKYHDAIQ